MLPYVILAAVLGVLWRLEQLAHRYVDVRAHDRVEELRMRDREFRRLEVNDIAQRDREDKQDQMADERRGERLRLKERAIALRERIHAPSVEPPPMPQSLVDWSLSWGDGWAQDDALKRARELYTELEDWDAVLRTVQKQRPLGVALGQDTNRGVRAMM